MLCTRFIFAHRGKPDAYRNAGGGRWSGGEEQRSLAGRLGAAGPQRPRSGCGVASLGSGSRASSGCSSPRSTRSVARGAEGSSPSATRGGGVLRRRRFADAVLTPRSRGGVASLGSASRATSGYSAFTSVGSVAGGAAVSSGLKRSWTALRCSRPASNLM